jgi:hypothetical protein
MPVTPVGPLGAATGIGFQPTGGGKAAMPDSNRNWIKVRGNVITDRR